MTRDELRRKLLAGTDRILSHRLFLSYEDERLLYAQRELYAADDAVVDKLLSILTRDKIKET